MKLSTRARYGLRLMVELARELQKDKLIHLGKIARITGLSENYLAQLAIPLKAEGLLVGVAGKKGGYHFAKPADEIKIADVVRALIGQIDLAECVSNPSVCLNSSFCEARMIWVILSENIMEILERYTLVDLLDKDKREDLIKTYSHYPLLFPDRVMAESGDEMIPGCPGKTDGCTESNN